MSLLEGRDPRRGTPELDQALAETQQRRRQPVWCSPSRRSRMRTALRYPGIAAAHLPYAAKRSAMSPWVEEIERALLVKLFVGSPEQPPRITTYLGRGDPTAGSG